MPPIPIVPVCSVIPHSFSCSGKGELMHRKIGFRWATVLTNLLPCLRPQAHFILPQKKLAGISLFPATKKAHFSMSLFNRKR